MFKKETETLRRWLIIALIVLVALVSVVVFYTYYPTILGSMLSFLAVALFPFVFAWIVCVFTRPIVQSLQRYLRLPKTLAVCLTMLFCLGAMGALVAALILVIIGIISEVSLYFADPQNSLMLLFQQLQDFYLALDMDFSQVQEWLSLLGEAAGSLAGQGLNAAMYIVRATPVAIFMVVVTIVATFYWCRDEEVIKRLLGMPFSPARRQTIFESYEAVSRVIGSYLRSQIVLMLIAIVVCIVGLTILGVPNNLSMGLLAGGLDFIPVLGPGTVLVPWGVWLLINGQYFQGFGMLVIFVAMTLIRNLLTPKIVGGQMGLHPLAAISSIFIGLIMFGVVGLIIGPIVLGIILVLYRERKAKQGQPNPPTVPPPA